jgi:hypothetical protein
MDKVTVKKNDLLAALRQNREAHRDIFEEACEGYQAEAIRLLEEHLQRIRQGKRVQVHVILPVPADHTKDYDRVIRMVEMSVDDEIDLEASDFASYVMDDWRWKRDFLATNSTYSASATRALGVEL